MGLRCLLGHDFTEPTTEREREERGDEVITTIREVKECRRCGETQVVAENTEVTSLSRRFGGDTDARSEAGAESRGTTHTDDPVVAPETGSVESSSGPEAATGTDDVVDEAESDDDGFDHPRGDPDSVDPSVEDDAEIIQEGPADATSGESADDSADPSTGTEADVSAGGERGHGEWPNSDRTHPTEAEGENQPDASGGWPDPEAEHDAPSDGPDGRRDVEDAAATEARTGIASDVDRSGADHPATGTSNADADRPEPDRGTRTPAPEDEDVEFIDADAADDDSDDGPSPWPEQEGDDEGFDAEVGDGRPDEDVTVDGNLTPRVNPNAEVDEDAEFVESSSNPSTSSRSRSGADEGAGSRASGSSGTPTSTPPERAKNGSRNSGGGEGRRTERARQPTATHEVELTTTAGDREMEYVCPNCGKREPVGASSMRAGDICPECKRGYIEERELE